MQPDGKVLLGGVFTFINGTNRYGSLRLNADGSLDPTFVPDTNFNPGLFGKHYQDCGPDLECYDITSATAAAVQPDGKLVVGVRSEFWQCDPAGGGCNFSVSDSVVRLNANGSPDTSFNFTNTSSLGRVSSIALQSDGKVIIGSQFYSRKIARLNANGSLDSSFNPSAGPDDGVTSVALQPDGKLLIGGYFGAVDGTNRNGIARLNANGSLDNTFDPGGGSNGGVTALALQSNGKVVIGGDFTTVNGMNRNHTARLNTDGSLDSSFDPGTGANGSIVSVALQPDGKVLIAGDFTTVNGVVRPRVAGLFGDSSQPPNLAPTVSISSPTEGSMFTPPATIAINVDAADSDGTIARVDVYAGDTLIGSDDSAPFAITWNNVAPGNYVLTGDATANLGAATTSSPVNISVTNSAPLVNISRPADRAI